jgi:hypothetical protein
MIDKVIDGMHISIDSIVIDVSSPGFVGKVELLNLDVHSTTPSWKIDRLSKTRIIVENIDMVTIFKQVVWQHLKVEFSSEKATQTDAAFSPLKLLTSQGQLNITVRKRLSDCVMECGRLEVILEEYLLWVLTLSQLKEAILFAQKLSDIICLAKEKSKKAQPLAKDPLAHVNSSVDISSRRTASQHASQHPELLQQLAECSWYLKETSHHLRLGALHLQLCDDCQVSCLSDDVQGSMHVSCNNFSIDFHPKHPTIGERRYWPMRNNHAEDRDSWVKCLLYDQAEKLRAKSQKQVNNWKELYESSFVLGCSKFSLTYYESSEACRDQKPFLASDSAMNLSPSQTTSFQLDYTTYYYQNDIQLPVPHSNLHLSVNPVQLTIEPSVCLWLASFVKAVFDALWKTDLNGQVSATQMKGSSDSPVDTLFYSFLPTITVPVKATSDSQLKQPDAIQVQGSKITATNCSRDARSQAAVDELILSLTTDFQGQKLFSWDHSAEFPSHEDDLRAIPNITGSAKNPSLSRALSVWSFSVDQFWAQFMPRAKGQESVRPEQFLGSVPITGWVVFPTGFATANENVKYEPDIHAIVRIKDTVIARLNHSEYLFLFSFRDITQKLLTDMSKLLYETNCEDTTDTTNTTDEAIKISIAALVDDIHISVVPPQDQIQSDVQSHSTVDSRQSPAMEKQPSPSLAEEKNSDESIPVSPLVMNKDESCKAVGEYEEGVSLQQSCESSASEVVADNSEVAYLKDLSNSSMARPASADNVSAPETSHESQLPAVTSSTSLPAVTSHNIQHRCASEGDIPAVTVTKPENRRCDIGEDYVIIHDSEFGSSSSLSSQGSSMSGSLYGGLTMTEHVKEPQIQMDAVNSMQQFEISGSTHGSQSGESTPTGVGESTSPVELKTDAFLADEQMPSGSVKKQITQGDPVMHESGREGSCGQGMDECVSDSSAQQCLSALHMVVVMEIRLKGTQMHTQLNGQGSVMKVATEDIWLKEDQLPSKILADLEHRQRRKMISVASHPGGSEKEKAQMKLRFHALVANTDEGTDYLVYVKVNGLKGELQLPTAFAMLDFIDDDTIPVPSGLPFIVEVSTSQFGIRMPELDDRLMTRYREHGLPYTPEPLVFQIKKVKIRRGRNGIFVVEEIGDNMMAQPLATECTVMESADESKTPLVCNLEHDEDRAGDSDMTDSNTDTDVPMNQLPKPKPLFEVAEENSDEEIERMARENADLKKNVDGLKNEVVALKQIAEAAQLGKQELIRLISGLQEELSEAKAENQQMENQVLSLKSVLLAQELAADGMDESPKWQRQSPDKK